MRSSSQHTTRLPALHIVISCHVLLHVSCSIHFAENCRCQRLSMAPSLAQAGHATLTEMGVQQPRECVRTISTTPIRNALILISHCHTLPIQDRECSKR